MTRAIPIDIGVEGWFTFEAFKRDIYGREIKGTRRRVAHFKNIITNTGLNALLTPDTSGNQQFGYSCAIGSGNQAPLATDTALQSFLQYVGLGSSGNNGKPSNLYTKGYAPDSSYTFHRWCFRFADGYAAFNNIQEVGIFAYGLGGSPLRPVVLCSRQLTLDQGGNPTSLAIQPDETLDVYYEVRYYPPSEDVVGSVLLNGVNYPYNIRPIDYNANTYNAWNDATGSVEGLRGLQAFGTNGAWANAYYDGTHFASENNTLYPREQLAVSIWGSKAAPESMTRLPYVANSFQRTCRLLFNLQHGNYANGIGSLFLSTGLGGYKVTFTGAKVPKTSAFKWTQDFIVRVARR